MYRPLGDAWQAYWVTTARLTNSLEQGLKSVLGIHLGDYNLMFALSEAPEGKLRMGELARSMVFSPSRLTYQVKILEKRGLVQRVPSEKDGRSFDAVLTAEGKRLFRRAAVVHSRQVQQLFTRHVSEEEHELLHSVFTRIASKLPDE